MGGRECFSETIHQMGISLTSIWCDFIGNYAVIFNTNKSKTHSHEYIWQALLSKVNYSVLNVYLKP